MSRVTLVFLLIAVAYIGLSNAFPKCSTNEDFLLCRMHSEPKCPIVTQPFDCIALDAISPQRCHPRGCQCKKGYMRSSLGKCVVPQDC